MKLFRRESKVSIRKATYYAVVINGLQILLILAVLFAVLIIPEIQASPRLLLMLTLLASLVVIWGAVVDISEALPPAACSSSWMTWMKPSMRWRT